MNKKRILVVDDEVGFTRLLRLVLSAYEIREVNDPAHAVATALEFKPDLILLDFIMPEMDGATLAASIREQEILRSVPIVFLTAIAYAKKTEQPKTIDGLPCLVKPISKDKLVECLREYLPD